MAEPGYYSVFLDRYGVQAELTSTARAAIHRYTFPETEEAGFILDLDYSIQHQLNRDMVIEVVSDTNARPIGCPTSTLRSTPVSPSRSPAPC